jgi:hypothetical protein
MTSAGRKLSAVLTAGVMLWGGAAFAQGKPAGCDRSRTPDKMEGRVVRVDEKQEKVTIRASDGTTHEFHASKETLKDYKVGDRIEATLRSAPNC